MAVPLGTIVKHKDGYYADPLSAGPGMANPLQMGQQGYERLNADYAPITADALATRDRNMGRIDQYGNSLRSDLDIKNQQALAAARQSAISRGLGNTTIQDSLVRGQNFDYGRQKMALEDQLLQNRISTDSALSKTYQDTLQSRAQGLASQWNQNTGIYQQGIEMQNANEQAALNRAQNQYLNPRTTGVNVNYANVPQFGAFAPAGYVGMTSNTFNNRIR